MARWFFKYTNSDAIEAWLCGRHTRLHATAQNLLDTSMVS
jgi:hypothetical protein